MTEHSAETACACRPDEASDGDHLHTIACTERAYRRHAESVPTPAHYVAVTRDGDHWRWVCSCGGKGIRLIYRDSVVRLAEKHAAQFDGSIVGLPDHWLDPESGDYVSEPLRLNDGSIRP